MSSTAIPGSASELTYSPAPIAVPGSTAPTNDIDIVGTLRMLNEEDLKALGVCLSSRRLIAAALSTVYPGWR